MEKILYEETFKAEEGHWWLLALHELIEGYVCRHWVGRSKTRLDILDAGCGTGKLVQKLVKYGEVDGIDFSEDAIDFCQKRGLANVRRTNLNEWQPEKSYDVITNIDVLYHKAILDDAAILQKFHAALKPGGLLILNIAAFECLKRSHDTVGHGARRYLRSKLVPVLEKIGFRILTQSYRGICFFFPALIQGWIHAAGRSSESASNLGTIPFPILNGLLLNIIRFENTLMKFFNLPLGVSLFVVAEKRADF